MLLDRSLPNDQQGFGDYLSDLGKKNGFSDYKSFKLFLMNSSKARYYVRSGYPGLIHIISGLFVELGIDQTNISDSVRPQCFQCLHSAPCGWEWHMISERECEQSLTADSGKLFEAPREKFWTDREDYCGLIRCSVKGLGLNFSSRKAGLYYADMLSKVERESGYVSRIYPTYHKAFLRSL